ncbi:MAG: M20 family metallopeptidase [Acidobacteriota bacterium]
MSTLVAHFEARVEGVLGLIRALVERETTSRHQDSLDEIALFVSGQFEAIGGKVQLFAHPGFGTNLVARFLADRFPAETPQLLIVGHLDTVWPPGTLSRLPFRITDDGKGQGPGIFDMKSGIAVLIESLRAARDLGLKTRRPVTVLLTCDEEIGSRTSRPLIEEEARRSFAAFVLEPPLAGGVVKTGRKGIGVYRIVASGRAAHAGLDPEKGVNAIIELAHQSLRLTALNDFERGTTVSVCVINGGTTSNVIPAEATAHVDVRFWTAGEGERIDQAIRSLTPVLDGARIEIGGGINRPPMPRSPANVELFEHARGLAVQLGFELTDASVGGGSDGNFIAALGVPTLDGLGVDGAGAHAEHEHILVADLPRRAALLTRLIETT